MESTDPLRNIFGMAFFFLVSYFERGKLFGNRKKNVATFSLPDLKNIWPFHSQGVEGREVFEGLKKIFCQGAFLA